MIDTTKISLHVDAMIAEDELPTRANLKVQTQFSGLFETDDSSDDELTWGEPDIEAWLEFIRNFLQRDLHLLEIVPRPKDNLRFPTPDLDEFGNDTSAYSTMDYQKEHPDRFIRYQFYVKRLCEFIKHLAIDYSIVKEAEAKTRIRNRAFEFIKTNGRNHKEELFQVWLDFAYWV